MIFHRLLICSPRHFSPSNSRKLRQKRQACSAIKSPQIFTSLIIITYNQQWVNPEIALRYWIIPVFDIFFLTAFAFAVSYDCRSPVTPSLIRRGRSLNTNCRGLLHSSNNFCRAVSTGSRLSNTFSSSPGQLHPSTAQPPPLTQSRPLVNTLRTGDADLRF
jgi:hypothetical protein